MILLDIAPLPPRLTGEIYDTIDTVAAPLDQLSGAPTSSGDSATTIWTFIVALLSLAICILFVYNIRRQRLAQA